jgi:Tol biopolymer transport system component
MFKRLMGMMAAAVVLLSVVGAARAQGGDNVAFVNSSGQLIVTSGDGGYRWIVTNPGETLAQPVGFSWSPDGRRLFFAVNVGGAVSLRVGDLSSQRVTEIGQGSGAVSGGDWLPDGSAILLSSGGTIGLYPSKGGQPKPAGNGDLISPFQHNEVNVPLPHSLSPDGRVWLIQSGGQYALQAANGASTPLNVSNDADAPQSGLWSDNGEMVAYWGFDASGSSVVAVADSQSGQTVTLSSGRTTPITPLAWRPRSAQLVYRDATNFVRIADVGCLASQCGANPLEQGAQLLPATASDAQFANGDWVVFRDGDQVKAVNVGCVGGDCIGSAMTLGTNAAPRTWVNAAGNVLAYTAFNQNANDPNDREVRLVSLGCLGNPSSCQPTALLAQAAAGLLSPDGKYVVVDQIGTGINALQIASLNLNSMSDPLGGQLGAGLVWARWA